MKDLDVLLRERARLIADIAAISLVIEILTSRALG